MSRLRSEPLGANKPRSASVFVDAAPRTAAEPFGGSVRVTSQPVVARGRRRAVLYVVAQASAVRFVAQFAVTAGARTMVEPASAFDAAMAVEVATASALAAGTF